MSVEDCESYNIYFSKKISKKFGKCEFECENKEKLNIITALDGEIICFKCGSVRGQVNDIEGFQDELETNNGEVDLHTKILENMVIKKGWEF